MAFLRVYKSLNCGSGSKDKKFCKKKPYSCTVKNSLKKNKIILLYQVHSAVYSYKKNAPKKNNWGCFNNKK